MKASPFLLFDGNCAEAMTFYKSCLGGELTLTKLGDTPMKSTFPPDKHDRIINARLSAGAVDISATDWMASPDLEPQLGNMSAVFLTADRYDELKPVFDKLAEGASKDWFQDLHEMPFGWYGQFFDRHGVQWIFRAAAQ
jgi:PhnB protein